MKQIVLQGDNGIYINAFLRKNIPGVCFYFFVFDDSKMYFDVSEKKVNMREDKLSLKIVLDQFDII